VGVSFLSDAWAQALSDALNANEAFRTAAMAHEVTIQQVITRPDGETRYWTRIAAGAISMGIGDAEVPDATITQSYDTAVALARRELNPVTGFMMGKIKVQGNMGMLLGLQGVLSFIADAMGDLEVDY